MGIKSLLAGTIHPAAYVFLGNTFKIKDNFTSFNVDSLLNTKPIEIYKKTLQYFTVENAEHAVTRIGEQLTHIDLRHVQYNITKSFYSHAVEWQSAAVWGATSTVANMVLKKIPVIKHHEYLRISLATVIGAAGTMAMYQYGLEQELPLNHFLEVAYKVALIGIPLQVLNRSGQLGLNITYASAEKIASVVKGSCSFGLATLKFFAWEGPEKIRAVEKSTPASSAPKKTKNKQPPKKTKDAQPPKKTKDAQPPKEAKDTKPPKKASEELLKKLAEGKSAPISKSATVPAREKPPRSSSPSPERETAPSPDQTPTPIESSDSE